jgi:tetratricopeptide (TPR) repeat protein
MTKTTILLVLLASLLVFSDRGHTAGSLASGQFADGTKAFEAGDYLQALSQFQAARDSGMTGPAIHYNIAVCHYKLAEYRQAEAVFRQIAHDYPAMRELAQYNAGLALERQGREVEAQSLFMLAQQNATNDRLARLAAAKVARTEESRRAGAPGWLTLFDFTVGHDDNVALLDEAAMPVGQPADSPFTEITAYATGPLRKATGMRLDASGYFARYADADEFDQNVIRIAGIYQWRADAWRMEGGPFVSRSTLGGRAFDERLGVGLTLRRAIARDYTFGARVARDEIDSGENQYRYVTGSRNQLQFTVDRRTAANRLILGLDLESNDREDASVSPTRRRLWLRHQYVLNGLWTTDLFASYRASSYHELAPSRDEDLIEASAGLSRRLGSDWEFNARYIWAKNDSSVEPFAYERNRLGMGVSKGF